MKKICLTCATAILSLGFYSCSSESKRTSEIVTEVLEEDSISEFDEPSDEEVEIMEESFVSSTSANSKEIDEYLDQYEKVLNKFENMASNSMEARSICP